MKYCLSNIVWIYEKKVNTVAIPFYYTDKLENIMTGEIFALKNKSSWKLDTIKETLQNHFNCEIGIASSYYLALLNGFEDIRPLKLRFIYYPECSEASEELKKEFNNIFLSKEKILKLNKRIESKIRKNVNAYLKNHPRTMEQNNLMK